MANVINKVDPAFSKWRESFVPVSIKRDNEGKKQAIPRKWKNNEKYKDSDFTKNSVALRTGNGLGLIDVDTKDLSLLNDEWRPLITRILKDKSTLIVETFNGYHIYCDTGDFKLRTTTKTGSNKSPVPFIDFRGEGGMSFIYSNAQKVSYKVLSNAAPQRITDKVRSMLPEKTDRKKKESVPDWAKEDLPTHSKKEVLKMLMCTPKKYVDRDDILSKVADTYALLENKDDLEDVVMAWTDKNWGDKVDDDVLMKVIDEVATGSYGESWNGGTLVDLAKEGGYTFSKKKEKKKDKKLMIINYDDLENKLPQTMICAGLPLPQSIDVAVMIAGVGDTGKSYLTLLIAESYLKQFKDEKVLFWYTEDAEAVVRMRIDEMGVSKDVKSRMSFVRASIDEVKESALKSLQKLTKDYGMTVLDPMLAFYVGEENSNNEANTFTQQLKKLHGLILVIHHSSKSGEIARGASQFRNAMRMVYKVERFTETFQVGKTITTIAMPNRLTKRFVSVDKDNHSHANKKRFEGICGESKGYSIDMFDTDIDRARVATSERRAIIKKMQGGNDKPPPSVEKVIIFNAQDEFNVGDDVVGADGAIEGGM